MKGTGDSRALGRGRDPSACYLAAGRPVITQQTGFTNHYGNSGGLFGFRSLGEIAEAVRAINAARVTPPHVVDRSQLTP